MPFDSLVPVAVEATASFAAQGFVCQTDIVIAVGANVSATDPTGYSTARVKQLDAYIKRHAPAGRIQYQGQQSALKMTVSLTEGQNLDIRQEYCVSASQPLKAGTQRIEIAFPSDGPPELNQPLRNPMVVSFKKNSPAALDTGTVGKRAWNRIWTSESSSQVPSPNGSRAARPFANAPRAARWTFASLRS
jgi:hypothetical protein